jgi:hypothetical protein
MARPHGLRYIAQQSDIRVAEWFSWQAEPLAGAARHWFRLMRDRGQDVRELLHDGCPVACVGDAPFAYVNVFKAHANVGFFHGASLEDPEQILLGNGRYMRHVRIEPGKELNDGALEALVRVAYTDIKARLQRHAQV